MADAKRKARMGQLGAVIAAVPVLLLAGGIALSQSTRPSTQEGLAAWEKVASVLQHPRCLNCHQVKYPLQGNVPREHVPRVERGTDNHGIAVLKCSNCHGSANNLTSRVPGAGDGHWQLAPLSMNWQGLSLAELCRQLKDPKRNGNRDGKALIAHMDKPTADPLVLWGWEPGEGRDPIPIPHSDFVHLLKLWVDSGQVCPR